MARYRCMGCENDRGLPGREFESATPVCPGCGADARNPRHANHIVELRDIHYDAPSRVKGVGVGYRACDPTKRLPDGNGVTGSAFTGEPSAVTCQACLATFAEPPAPPVVAVDHPAAAPMETAAAG